MTKIFSKTKGIAFNKSFLEKILEKSVGESYSGFKIKKNSLIFKDDYPSNCEVIMEKEGEFFKFPYIVHFGEKSIGEFNSQKIDANDLRDKYFCEKLDSVSHVY